MTNRTFEELWKIAYIEYLKLRQSLHIKLTEDETETLRKAGVHLNGRKNGNNGKNDPK